MANRDYVVYEVVDVADGHTQLVVAQDVVEAANKITRWFGPKLRGYTRVATIDRMVIESVHRV